MPESHEHVVRINFDNGAWLQTELSNWLALLFGALHPTQQEQIADKIKAMAQAQQQQPRILMPAGDLH